MKKNKVHDIAAKLGYKTNEDFYKDFPTEDIYKAYCNGGKIGMKDGGNIKPPKKEISLSGGLFGASKFANKKGGWDSLNDPNSFMTANGKVNYFAPLNKNSNAFFKGSVGTANFLSRLEPENYLQRDNNGNLTYNVAPEGYENENDFIASARLGMQTPQKKKFNRFTDRGEISAGLDYANGNIYPGAGFNYSADYNFRRRNSLPNTQYNKTAGSVGVYGDVNIAPVGIGKEQFENYAGTDSSSEFNQAMRTNLGVKAQYNFPKNGFFVRGNAEVNPLITNFKDGIKTLPNAQLTIGQRFKNGGMIKSRLPKYVLGGNPNVPLLTNEQVLANMAPGGDSLQGINQSLGFFKTPGNAPVIPPKVPTGFKPSPELYAQAGELASSGIQAAINDKKIGRQSFKRNGEIIGSSLAKGIGYGAAAGSVIPGIGTLVGAAGGAIVGGVAGLVGASNNSAKMKKAEWDTMAEQKYELANNSYNPNPYGTDSSYAMNAYNGGLINMYADGGNMYQEPTQVDGGQLNHLASDAQQVASDNPQGTDNVNLGQAMVDNNEVIQKNKVYSDNPELVKAIPKDIRKQILGKDKTFAITAARQAKLKGKFEKRALAQPNDPINKNSIQFVQNKLDKLFDIQEQVATSLGMRDENGQTVQTAFNGGKLRYDNGGWDPFNLQPLQFSSGVPNYNIINPTSDPIPYNWQNSQGQEVNNMPIDNTSYNPFNWQNSQGQEVNDMPVDNTGNQKDAYAESSLNPLYGKPIPNEFSNIIPKIKNNNPPSSLNPFYGQPLPNQMSDIIPRRNINPTINPITSKTPPATVKPPLSREAGYDSRYYDNNYLLSTLGNIAQALPFTNYDKEYAVYNPNENEVTDYYRQMPNKVNIQPTLDELRRQQSVANFNASQNTPSGNASLAANNLAITGNAINQAFGNKVNTETQLETNKLGLLAQDANNAGISRQNAINKAALETAQNKGNQITNLAAVTSKQALNSQKANTQRGQIGSINDILKYYNYGSKGGIFASNGFAEDTEKVRSAWSDGLLGTVYFNSGYQDRKKLIDKVKKDNPNMTDEQIIEEFNNQNVTMNG